MLSSSLSSSIPSHPYITLSTAALGDNTPNLLSTVRVVIVKASQRSVREMNNVGSLAEAYLCNAT